MIERIRFWNILFAGASPAELVMPINKVLIGMPNIPEFNNVRFYKSEHFIISIQTLLILKLVFHYETQLTNYKILKIIEI